MFEKYTEDARRVIFIARYEAARHGAREFEPVHLLMGILQQREIAALFGDDLPLESIRSRIAQSLPVGSQPLPDQTDLPLTHASKRIVVYAAEESEMMRHRTISCAHILLGIHRESRGRQASGILGLFTRPPSPEAAILIEHGADYDTLRTRIVRGTRE